MNDFETILVILGLLIGIAFGIIFTEIILIMLKGCIKIFLTSYQRSFISSLHKRMSAQTLLTQSSINKSFHELDFYTNIAIEEVFDQAEAVCDMTGGKIISKSQKNSNSQNFEIQMLSGRVYLFVVSVLREGTLKYFRTSIRVLR